MRCLPAPLSVTSPLPSMTMSGPLSLKTFAVLSSVRVTGSGPHPGDSTEVHRIPVDWTAVTVLHGILAAGAITFAVLTVLAARRHGDALVSRRATVLLVALLAQGAIGVYQSLDGLPAVAVMLHLAGAAFTWAGTVRVLLATRMPAVAGDRRPEAAPVV